MMKKKKKKMLTPCVAGAKRDPPPATPADLRQDRQIETKCTVGSTCPRNTNSFDCGSFFLFGKAKVRNFDTPQKSADLLSK